MSDERDDFDEAENVVDDDQRWSLETAERIRITTRAAAAALIEHADRVAALRADDADLIRESSDAVARLLIEAGDAQFEHAWNAAPLGYLGDYFDDEDSEGDEEDAELGADISVYGRHDYRVDDEAAVIAAGREAYLRVWPDDSPQDAEEDVTDLGRALYQIAHAAHDDWGALDQVEGLRQTASMTTVVPTTEELAGDPWDWPELPAVPPTENALVVDRHTTNAADGTRFRAATPADVPEILALWEVAAENDSRPTDDASKVETLLARDPAALDLAVVDGRIVGTLASGWDGWRAHLYRLAVHPDSRRRGIGAQLLARAEARLRDLGAPRIDAMVLEANELGQSIWTADGYSPQPEWRRWVKSI